MNDLITALFKQRKQFYAYALALYRELYIECVQNMHLRKIALDEDAFQFARFTACEEVQALCEEKYKCTLN